MPVLATQHSAAGARAFAEFFVKTIDWGYATTSGSYMRHYYSPSCKYCTNAAYSLDETARRGSFHIGNRFFNIKTTGRGLTAGGQAVADTRFYVSADTVLSSKRKVISSTPPTKFGLTTRLEWAGRWIVVNMVDTDLGNE